MIPKNQATLPSSLNARQLAYCTLRAKGNNKAQSYLQAGYKAKDITQAGSAACKLENDERVLTYIKTLQESSFLKDALSVAEKRAFLAATVRANPLDPDLPGHLIQEARTEVDPAGNIKKVIKLPSKLEAINIDNKMAGDNYADRAGSEIVNPFLAIVSLFSNQPGTLPAMPAQARVIEAEILPAD